MRRQHYLRALLAAAIILTPALAQTKTKAKAQPKSDFLSSLRHLTLDECIAWRNTYGDLLGKTKDVAIERYGPPETQNPTTLEWTGNAKTDSRAVRVISIEGSDKILFVFVFPKPSEILGVMEVLKKAPLFTFESGIYSNSTDGYFAANKKESKDTFRFRVTQYGLSFEAMIFN